MIEVKNISKAFEGKVIIDDITAKFIPGICNLIIGTSGSGKTVLIKCIVGLLPVDQGAILYEGEDFVSMNDRDRKQLRTQIGMLFQEPLLFPHLSVLENLLFAIPKKYSKAQKIQLANQALIDAQLTGMGPQDPSLLSGGQKARVALMRALLAEPQALLLDEPFSKLDESLRQNIRQFVFETVRKRAIPVLIVTHDAADIADLQHVSKLVPLNTTSSTHNA